MLISIIIFIVVGGFMFGMHKGRPFYLVAYHLFKGVFIFI